MSGIQSLLKTEKEAQEVVAEARQYRAQKLKAAKTDASAEVDAYKAKKDAELKKFEENFSGNNKQLEDDAEKSVVEELAKIKKTCEAKKSDVIKLLVKAVTEPKPSLHANVTV